MACQNICAPEREHPPPTSLLSTLDDWRNSADPARRQVASDVDTRLRNFVKKKMSHTGTPELRRRFSQILLRGRDDAAVFEQLRALHLGRRLSHAARQVAKRAAAGRWNSRVSAVEDEFLLHRAQFEESGREVRCYLDVGCAEGDLTKVFGERLGLVPTAVHGCDIHPQPPGRDFVYHQVTPDGPLPFDDGTIDVVTAIMMLHHVADPMTTLSEIRRVLAPGGIFVLREHDCDDESLSLFLDLVHAIYSTVFSTDRRRTDVCEATPRLAYHSRQKWNDMVVAAGFDRSTVRRCASRHKRVAAPPARRFQRLLRHLHRALNAFHVFRPLFRAGAPRALSRPR